MGLVGIHDPDALWHFVGFTYCPWCGKEGQSEGTVVNHLRTSHYRLGLMCDKCHGCPTTTCNTFTIMAITIVVESILLLSQSHLTNPLPKLRTPTRNQDGIVYLGSFQGKARLISSEGGVCQTTYPSLIPIEFDKAASCSKE